MLKGKEEKIIVEQETAGRRLDIFLSKKLGLSRSQAQKMIERGLVMVNGRLPKKSGDKLKIGDEIEIKIKNEKENVEKDEKNIKILKETNDYIVLDKPAGLLVHPTEAGEQDTLVDWLLKKYPEIKNVGESAERPGIVHRLDRGASGLMVVARTQQMFAHLKKQFQKREVEKEYLVLAYGRMESDTGAIDFPLDRGEDGKMIARPKIKEISLTAIKNQQEGRESLTEFWVEKRFSRFTLLRIRIHTGRTHQIRAHLFAYDHPVVGDGLYFNKKWFKKSDQKLGRLFLHAARLCFTDLTDERKCWESELPEKLEGYLRRLH